MIRYLVIHDVDTIQGYVFATGRLREIRGASALIDKLNRQDSYSIMKQHGGEFIFSGGGGFAAYFADESNARFFCQSVSALYVKQTYSASSTGVVECYDESAPPDARNSFYSALKKAHRRLRQEKVRRRRQTQLLTSSLFKRCQACGIYPAAHYDARMLEAEEHFICQSCYTKRQQGGPQIHQHIQREAQRHGKDIGFPTQIDEIGDAADPKGYIGVVYADGNRMGDRLQCIQTRSALEKFSKVIDDAVRDAITEVFLRRCDGILSMKVNVPLCGGDDLVVVVPGQYAFELAIDYLEAFQNQVRQNLPDYVAQMLNSREVSACAGVAIAKSHTPLSALFELSHDLCGLAKKRSYELFRSTDDDEKREIPCVDFQVITTPGWGELEETRRTEYRLTDQIRLTARPYTVEEARKLICAVRRLRKEKLPLSKLHNLYLGLRRGRFQASLNYLTLYVRARENRHIKQRTALLEAASYLEVERDRVPWQDWAVQRGFLQTPYGDLVEIYGFIPD